MFTTHINFEKAVFGMILMHLCVNSTFGTLREYFHRISDNVTTNYVERREDTSILQCATLCVRNQTCTTIQYFKNNRTCSMLFDAQENTIFSPMWTHSTMETYSRTVNMVIFMFFGNLLSVC